MLVDIMCDRNWPQAVQVSRTAKASEIWLVEGVFEPCF